MNIPDDKVIFAIAFTDYEGGFECKYGRRKPLPDCMDALYTFVEDALEKGDENGIDVFNIIMSVCESVKFNHPEIAKSVRQMNIEFIKKGK